MNKLTVVAAAACALAVCSSLAMCAQSVRMPRVFSDNMVLQSGSSTPVWGWASPGEKVSVMFGSQTVSATAGKDGKWMVRLRNLKQSAEPAVMTVKGSGDAIEISNILVGDIWVGSGQSNMEWGVGGVRNAQEEIAAADFPEIRLFRVPTKFIGQPKDDVDAQWVVCSPQTVGNFSAVLYFFGREIHQKTGTPLGLLQSCVGGTNIERWMTPESFKTKPSLADFARDIDQKDADYRAAVSAKMGAIDVWVAQVKDAVATGKPIPASPLPDHPQGNPTTLYNGMIHPIIPFGIKGAIWYQGESNGSEDQTYQDKMEALVGGWRKLWGRGDFPFYYVQLAAWQDPNDNPTGGDGWAGHRDAQRRTMSTLINSGMASAIDLADLDNFGDIHPRNKQDVGKRLALWALAKDYGLKSTVYSGPLYKGMKIEDGTIRLSFDSVGSGLMVGEKAGLEPTKEVKGGTLKRFAIAGEDKKWVWADAQIDGNTVVVSSREVPNPVAVRYAYSMNPAGANLYNKEGLPASPFRTDKW